MNNLVKKRLKLYNTVVTHINENKCFVYFRQYNMFVYLDEKYLK